MEEKNSRQFFQRRYKIPLVSLLIYTGVILTLGFFAIIGIQNLISGSSVSSINSTVIKTALESTNELVTSRYYYSDVGKFENSLEINGWSIPFTNKNFLLTYQGEILIGLDPKECQVEVQNNQIIIHAAPLKVISSNIDESSIEVYDESKNVFNPITVSDYVQFATHQEKEMLQKLLTESFVSQAQADASNAITQIYTALPGVKDQYEFKIIFEEDTIQIPESVISDQTYPSNTPK